ncbi:hypothetical protein DFH11DRAFT_1732715 [Phellopilus nigrolimitatus]|nr:hypothetical protein DFH11DRAFT_1732715 [Phellopilus nigrolimitatus]
MPELRPIENKTYLPISNKAESPHPDPKIPATIREYAESRGFKITVCLHENRKENGWLWDLEVEDRKHGESKSCVMRWEAKFPEEVEKIVKEKMEQWEIDDAEKRRMRA